MWACNSVWAIPCPWINAGKCGCRCGGVSDGHENFKAREASSYLPPSSFIRSHLIWAQISCFLVFAIASNQGWLWKKSQRKCLRVSKCIEFEKLSQCNVIFCLVSVFDVSPCSQLTALSRDLAVFWGVGSLYTLKWASLVWSRKHGCQACETEKWDVKSGKAPFCAAREESARCCSGFPQSFKGQTSQRPEQMKEEDVLKFLAAGTHLGAPTWTSKRDRTSAKGEVMASTS